MLGKWDNNIGGSEYLRIIHGKVMGPLTCIDWEYEKRLNALLMENIERFSSLHDVSDGGLAVALFESAYYGDTGIKINIGEELICDRFMFSETSGRVIFCAENNDFDKIRRISDKYGIPFTDLGLCEGDDFQVNDIRISMKELSDIFERGIL